MNRVTATPVLHIRGQPDTVVVYREVVVVTQRISTPSQIKRTSCCSGNLDLVCYRYRKRSTPVDAVQPEHRIRTGVSVCVDLWWARRSLSEDHRLEGCRECEESKFTRSGNHKILSWSGVGRKTTYHPYPPRYSLLFPRRPSELSIGRLNTCLVVDGRLLPRRPIRFLMIRIRIRLPRSIR